MKYITIQKLVKGEISNSTIAIDVTYDQAKLIDKKLLSFKLKMAFYEIYIMYPSVQIYNNSIYIKHGVGLDFHKLSEKYKNKEEFKIEFGEITFTEKNIILNITTENGILYVVKIDVNENEKLHLSNYFSEVNDEVQEILKITNN